METIITELKQSIENILGEKYIVIVQYHRLLGRCITVIVNEKPTNNIWQNYSVAIHLICHLDNSEAIGQQNQNVRLSFESLGHTRIKFRKLTSKKGLTDLNYGS